MRYFVNQSEQIIFDITLLSASVNNNKFMTFLTKTKVKREINEEVNAMILAVAKVDIDYYTVG